MERTVLLILAVAGLTMLAACEPGDGGDTSRTDRDTAGASVVAMTNKDGESARASGPEAPSSGPEANAPTAGQVADQASVEPAQALLEAAPPVDDPDVPEPTPAQGPAPELVLPGLGRPGQGADRNDFPRPEREGPPPLPGQGSRAGEPQTPARADGVAVEAESAGLVIAAEEEAPTASEPLAPSAGERTVGIPRERPATGPAQAGGVVAGEGRTIAPVPNAVPPDSAVTTTAGVPGQGGPVAGPAGRSITVDVSYVARIALPSSSRVFVELRDARGASAGQSEQTTGRSGPPYRVAVAVPSGAVFPLRAEATVMTGPKIVFQGSTEVTATDASGPGRIDLLVGPG